MEVQVQKKFWLDHSKSKKKQKIDWKNKQHREIYAGYVEERLKRDLKIKRMNETEATACVSKLEPIMKDAVKMSIKRIYGKNKKVRKFRRHKKWWNEGLSKLLRGRNFTSTRIYDLELSLKRGRGTIGAAVNNTLNKLKFYRLARYLISKKFKKLTKKLKKEAKRAQRERLIESFLSNPEIFWKQVTSRRGTKIAVDINLETLYEAYKKNFTMIEKTPESEELERKMKNVVDKYSSLLISKKSKFVVKTKTVYEILHKLKNNKAGGLNGITNEMYKYAKDTTLPKVIANLFENIIRGNYFPVNLNIGLICTIVKDPVQSNQALDNTRPITLSEVLAIVLENFILGYLLKGETLHRHQFGFRKNSSCMHAVFSIKEVMEDVKRRSSNAYAVYLDFSKAFDKVNRTKLLYCMIKTVDPNIWLLVKHYYENLILYVIGGKGEISGGFKATVGVKQGGNMSPWLFNKYINNLIEQLEDSGRTYQLNGAPMGVMVYADDTNIITHTIEDLHMCVHIIERYCMRYDISINAKKTKWMLFARPLSILNEEVRVNGVILEKVDSFKFLGVIIRSDGCYKEHVQRRRAMFMTGLGEIQRLGFNEKCVPVKMKKNLYVSLVRSKLLYGLETVQMSESNQKSTLGRLEGNCLKMACGLNKRSKTTTLSYGMGITPIGLYLYKRKLNFIIELLNNRATNDLVSKGVHSTLADAIYTLGLSEEEKLLGPSRYLTILGNACLTKLNEIKIKEKLIKESQVVEATSYLLNHRSRDNDDTLQYLLDPRRGTRG
jgi:hypothetical protein